MSRAANSGTDRTSAPPHATPATRATSRRIWPFAQSRPRRTIGTERMPSAASSAKASLSSSTLTETKATPCLIRNSFILRQLVQPGCQYALIMDASGDACAIACSTNAQDTAFTRGSKDSTISTGRARSLLGRAAAPITPHDQRIHHGDTFTLCVDDDRVEIDRIDVVAVICGKMR